MGTAMSCNNIGIIISPPLGGIIYGKSGKMCVFAIMVALGAMDVILRVLKNVKTGSHPQSSQTKSINMESIEAIQAEEKGPQVLVFDMSRPTSSTNKLAGAELSLQPTH